MAIEYIVAFVLLGLLAGSLSGLLGIGGGVILVPALVFIFNLPEQSAQGTTLALMVPPIGLLAAWHYYKQGHVNLRVAGVICLGFALGGWLGAKSALLMSGALSEKIFAAALLLIAAKMLFFPEQSLAGEQTLHSHANRRFSLGSIGLFLLLGVFAGGLSGLLGIGGGVIIVPLLIFLFGFSQHDAQGTTLALMVPPIGLLAAWQYLQRGAVDLPTAGWVCLGFFVGGLLGARLASSVPTRVMSKIFGIAVILIAVKMLLA